MVTIGVCVCMCVRTCARVSVHVPKTLSANKLSQPMFVHTSYSP